MRQRGEPRKQTRGTNEADRRAHEATKGGAKELDRTRNEEPMKQTGTPFKQTGGPLKDTGGTYEAHTGSLRSRQRRE